MVPGIQLMFYDQNTQLQQKFIVIFYFGHFMSRYRQVPTF